MTAGPAAPGDAGDGDPALHRRAARQGKSGREGDRWAAMET